jgi:hypothetical protein
VSAAFGIPHLPTKNVGRYGAPTVVVKKGFWLGAVAGIDHVRGQERKGFGKPCFTGDFMIVRSNEKAS